HLKAFNLKYDLGRKWLMNIEPHHISDIVINHTGRYVNRHNRLEYEALNEFKDRCIFIGFEQEYQEFMKYSGMNIRRYLVKSIVEFAQIIKGSKLYIGNQSLGFALAEAMKTPRILEACCFNANCLPQSLNGHLRMDRRLLTAMLKDRRPLVVSTLLDNKLARIRNFISFRLKERKIKEQNA
ncbi:MAG: hypothetical protein PHV48_08180, partial [Candidatus Omnitrophica bacterium]|nr:hypothetical protein [Candidatus Omnitrophota bacterium]